jgi:hypothetical protein
MLFQAFLSSKSIRPTNNYNQQEEVNTCIPLLLLKNRNQDDSQWKVAPLKLQMMKAASSRINRFPTVPSKIVASLQRHVS